VSDYVSSFAVLWEEWVSGLRTGSVLIDVAITILDIAALEGTVAAIPSRALSHVCAFSPAM